MTARVESSTLSNPARLATVCCFLVLTTLCCLPIFAQQITSPVIAGQKEIKGKLSKTATGVEVQVNQATVKTTSTTVGGGAFSVVLESPLNADAKVRVRALENGAPSNWSEDATVYSEAASSGASSDKSSLSFTPGQLTFDSQPWGVASAEKTVTVKNVTKSSVDFVPRIIDSGMYQLKYKVIDSSSFVFSPTPDCQNPLPPDATCTLHVVYKPSGSFDSAGAGVIVNDAQTSGGATASGAAGKFMMQSESKAGTTYDALKKAVEGTATGIPQGTPEQPTVSPKELQKLNQSQTGVPAVSQQKSDKKQEQEKRQRGLQASSEFTKAIDNLVSAYPESVVKLTGKPEHWKYPFTRGVAGVDLSAPSSMTVKQAYFIEFDLLAPLGVKPWGSNELKSDPLDSRFWAWFNPRITSLPQSTNYSALSTINASGGFLDSLTKSGTTKDVAQGLDVSGGLEVALVKPHQGIGWWAEYPNTKARLAISAIGGVGMSTPFSTDKTDVLSKVNQSICDAYNNSSTKNFSCVIPTGSSAPVIQDPLTGTNKQFIDFVTPDRSRFFRRFYAGARLKTFFFSQDVIGDCLLQQHDLATCETPYDVFPGTVDISFGKDEAVTAGHFNKWLFRIEGSYPLPFYPGLHVFGSMYTVIGKSLPSPPFNAITTQAPNNNTDNPIQSDATTFRFPVPPLSRDYFRIGLGVDLIQVFKKSSNGGQPQKGGAASSKK